MSVANCPASRTVFLDEVRNVVRQVLRVKPEEVGGQRVESRVERLLQGGQ
jgi:hypothetical protein